MPCLRGKPLKAGANLRFFTGRGFLLGLLLAGLAAGVYLPSLRGPFLFDDEALFERPITSSYSQAIHQSSLNRKLPFVSFVFSRRLSGWDTWGWHLPNILLHAAVSVLVWRWLAAIGFASAFGCWIAAAAFALHPAQSMAVSYIYQRSTLLATCFMVASALCHLRARRDSDNRWLWGVLVCAALAALSKETALALPFLILFQEKAGYGAALPASAASPVSPVSPTSPNRDRVRRIVPAALAAFYTALVMARVIQAGGVRAVYPVPANLDLSWVQYVMTQVMVWPMYLVRWIWPFYQNADPDVRFVTSAWDWRWIAAAAGWGIALIVLRKNKHRIPALWFGAGWFLIALAPELLGVRDAFFEHRGYLAYAGLAAASCCLLSFCDKSRFRIIACVLALAILGSLTAARAQVWNSEVLFWQDVVRKSPGKSRGYLNLGAAYDRAGEIGKAKMYFERVLEFKSGGSRVKALSNLGMIAVREGNYRSGLLQMRSATRLNPGYQRHFFFVGLAMEKLGDRRMAIQWYRRAALVRETESCFQWQAANNLANLLLRLGRWREAGPWIDRGLRLRPGEPILIQNYLTWQKLKSHNSQSF